MAYGIKSFNNIEYIESAESLKTQSSTTNAKIGIEHMKVKCWRAWNIGNVKSFAWEDLQGVPFISPFDVVEEFSLTNNQWIVESQEEEGEEEGK